MPFSALRNSSPIAPNPCDHRLGTCILLDLGPPFLGLIMALFGQGKAKPRWWLFRTALASPPGPLSECCPAVLAAGCSQRQPWGWRGAQVCSRGRREHSVGSGVLGEVGAASGECLPCVYGSLGYRWSGKSAVQGGWKEGVGGEFVLGREECLMCWAAGRCLGNMLC